jgi:chromate transporter
VSLLSLALLIGAFNLMTFGSGTIMIPMLQAQFVDGAHVLTADQLLYAFTLGRVTPGQANVYVASIGYMLYGMPGAMASVLAISLPGYLMIPLVKGYERLRHTAWIGGFTRGLTVASVGVVLASVVQISRDALTGPLAWLVLAATLVMTQVLRWNLLVAIGIGGGLGLVLNALR